MRGCSRVKHRNRVIALAVLLLLAGTATVIVAQPVKKRPLETVALNREIQGVISVVDSLPAYQEYYLTVPEDIFLLEVQLRNAPADLDILLFSGEELVAYSELPRYNETLRISRISEPALHSGTYRLEIAYQYSRAPRLGTETLTEIPYDLYIHAPQPEVAATLRPGDTATGRLRPEEGMIQLYRIEVPIGSPTLRIDLSDTDADLDLFLNRGTPQMEPYASDYWSQSVRSTEILSLDRSSDPSLQPGTHYALVIDQISDNYPTAFRISVSDSASAPEHLLRRIAPPTAARPLDRPLLSTVEILTFNGGGSGVVVSPEGHILSNSHVVIDDSGKPATDITIGFSVDYGRPPQELYLAEVLEVAEDRDLALLKIVSGRYGEALGDEPFVFVEPRLDSIPDIGETLRFIGYPSIGGTGSRASITFTRGTVAGYQDVPFGRLIKTDGEINEGSSGGAALDESFRLVGLPTEVVGLDAGQLAFIYPVLAIPESWRAIIAPSGR